MMFQSVKSEFATGDEKTAVQHYLQEHLKPSKTPYVWAQCRIWAHVRCTIKPLAWPTSGTSGEATDDIYFGTLQPLKEEEIFKIQSPLHHSNLTQAGKPKQKSSCTLAPVEGTSAGLERATRDSSPDAEGGVTVGPRSASQSTLLPDRPLPGGETVQGYCQRVQVRNRWRHTLWSSAMGTYKGWQCSQVPLQDQMQPLLQSHINCRSQLTCP